MEDKKFFIPKVVSLVGNCQLASADITITSSFQAVGNLTHNSKDHEKQKIANHTFGRVIGSEDGFHNLNLTKQALRREYLKQLLTVSV